MPLPANLADHACLPPRNSPPASRLQTLPYLSIPKFFRRLLDEFAGKVDLIYIDPPFATGADFSYQVPIGEGASPLTKQSSIIEQKAYRDTWGGGLNSY